MSKQSIIYQLDETWKTVPSSIKKESYIFPLKDTIPINCPYGFTYSDYYENDTRIYRSWNNKWDLEKMLTQPVELKPTSHNHFRQSTHHISSKPLGKVKQLMYHPHKLNKLWNPLKGTCMPKRLDYYIEIYTSLPDYKFDNKFLKVSVSIYDSFTEFLDSKLNREHEYTYQVFNIEKLGERYIHIQYKLCENTEDGIPLIHHPFMITSSEFAKVSFSGSPQYIKNKNINQNQNKNYSKVCPRKHEPIRFTWYLEQWFI